MGCVHRHSPTWHRPQFFGPAGLRRWSGSFTTHLFIKSAPSGGVLLQIRPIIVFRLFLFLLLALHLLRPICPLTCHTSVGILDKRRYDETKTLGLIATLEVFGGPSSISVCSSQTLAATARFLPLGARWHPPLAARQPARAQAPRRGLARS